MIRKLVLKLILLIVILIGLFIINIWVFRSDWPLLWFLTSLASCVLIIMFPWKWYFNNKE